MFKRFDERIAKNPKSPKIIELEPADGFMRPCTAQQVEAKLQTCPPKFLEGLRAIFILAGTKKQLKSSNGAIGFWGHYWRSCVFLHAPPRSKNYDLNALPTFYLQDVLMHEIGHHVDGRPNTTKKERESFADWFAAEHG